MPDYSFFLSYASSDRIQSDRDAGATSPRDLIRRFFNDLEGQMKGLGYRDGGFFDKLRLEGKWKPELEEGLASSRIIVPLYSRNYFLSRYCGKEWETFNLRIDENETNLFPDVTSSTVILPVFWKAPVTSPTAVRRYQMDFVDYPPNYEKYGLEYLMQFSKNRNAYQEFLWTFSRKLLDLADRQGAAKVRRILPFDTLNAPFPGTNVPGLKVVRYLFVAGMQHEMTGIRVSNSSYPMFVDRRDWRPCFPDIDRLVEGIATAPAKAESRIFEFLTPSSSQELMTALRDARRLNNVIIVVVDPWSLRLPELRQFLTNFDAEEFPNSAVLINWNVKDPEMVQESQRLETLLQDQFRGRIGRKEFHKDRVSSAEGMEQSIFEAFAAIQARLIETGGIRPTLAGDPIQTPVIRN